MKKTLRAQVVGAHATGKSELARYISRRYGLPLLDEVARIEIAKMGRQSFDELRVDLAAATEFQRRVFATQLRIGQGLRRFVSDRAFDNVAYASNHADFGTAADLWELPACRRYVASIAEDIKAKRGVVFFVRPGVAARGDGTRATGDLGAADIDVIDGAIKLLLELGRVDYVPISTTNFAERARCVHGVMRFLT